jgi:hypothetical protein
MRKGIGAAAVALALMIDQTGAAAVCERAGDAMALKTAALQQEMMVAALVCRDVAAYNDFVLSHRAALQQSDAALLAFFVTANPRRGDADYNLYKTELANAASLRSMHDGAFCQEVRANFEASHGQPLEHALAVLPYPVDTGPVRCPEMSQAPDMARNDWQGTERGNN